VPSHFSGGFVQTSSKGQIAQPTDSNGIIRISRSGFGGLFAPTLIWPEVDIAATGVKYLALTNEKILSHQSLEVIRGLFFRPCFGLVRMSWEQAFDTFG